MHTQESRHFRSATIEIFARLQHGGIYQTGIYSSATIEIFARLQRIVFL